MTVGSSLKQLCRIITGKEIRTRSFGLPIASLVLKFVVCMAGFLLMPTLTHAQQPMPEGMIGWWQLDYTPGTVYNWSYASDPLSACTQTAFMHSGGGPLVDMYPAKEDGLIAFRCDYKLNATVFNYGDTYLDCKNGYIPQWPGVCTKKSEIPQPASCDASQPGNTVANPVVVSTGAKVQSELDFSIGVSNPLQISRTYRTQRRFMGNGSAGIAWSFSFDRYLSTASTTSGSPPASVWGVKGDGSYFKFDYANGVYSSPTSRTESLKAVSATFDEWELKDGNGQIDRFKKVNDAYRLISSLSREGVGQFFTYDADNRLQKIADSFGRSVQIAWKNKYLIDSIQGPTFLVQYEYEQPGASVTTPIPGGQRLVGMTIKTLTGIALASKRYHYEDPYNRFLLTGITDENGKRYANYAYDGSGQVTLSEHAGGAERFTFAYPDNYTRTITDPLGASRTVNLQTVRSFDRVSSTSQPGGAGCSAAASSYTYIASGDLASRTDFNGIKTNYIFDSVRALETSRVEAAGTTEARTITTDWHPTFRLPVKIAEPKRLTTFAYDANGNLLIKTEQATSDVSGAAGLSAVVTGVARKWSYIYNALGQVLSATGPRTDVSATTSYSYDSQGNLTTLTNAAGQVTTLTDYDANGRVGRIVDPSGLVTIMTYSPRGWLTSRTVGGETTGYQYDGVGQLKVVTLPDTSSISYTYDDAHRLTSVADSLGNRIDYTLDSMGNRVSEQVKDPSGTLARQTSRIYDALNRLQTVTGAAQ